VSAKGLSLNRDTSPLQPAMAALTSASRAACGKGRNHLTNKDIATHSYAIHKRH
jgi:hypothetical protein